MLSKNILTLALATLVTSFVVAQTTPSTITKNGNYDVQGNELLEATQSIMLLPNSWIRPTSGNSFIARIVAPGLPETPYDEITFAGSENYVFTRTFQKAMPTFVAGNALEGDVIESISYFDGLGRPIQGIQLKAAPDFKDWVTPFEYDAFGRQTKEWLPYPAAGQPGSVRTNPTAGVESYYLQEYAQDLSSSAPNPFSEAELETSPLSRVLKQGAPGEDWKLGNGHEIRMEYGSNGTNEVRYFEVSLAFANDTYTPTFVDNTTFYGEGELSKTITKDENWSSGQTHDKDHTVEEFTDKLGRVVLKRTYDENVPHDTFYVYDDFGNLTYVLSPKTDVSDGVSQTELNDLGYQYVYDRRNRLVEKKLPGKGWEYIVYNMLDQPVLTQDANLRANGDWLFTKYDAIGRVAYTGLHRQQTPLSRVDTQVFGDNTTTYEQYVTRQGTATTLDGTNVYYSNDAIPFGVSKLYTVSYYDDYVDEAGITLPTSVYQQNLRTNVHGLPTVNKVRVLETDDWITTVTGYDTKGRVIFTHSKNPYLETEDITELKLDFTGRILESRTTHKKTGNSDIVIVDNYNYDHMGRNVDHYQTINGSSQELIASNAYNGIGQLQTKSVGNQKTNPLQSMDYEYNVRGWLKSVISSRVNNNIFYEMKLSYNSPPSGSNAQSLFNGNISSFYCGAPGDISTGTSYDYEYDALNRLVSATDTKSYGYFSVPSITYDKNGNIKTLKRNGHLTENPDIGQTVFGLMDDLTYVYVGNSLKNVSEAGHSQHGFRKEEILVNDDYRYDDNGNLTNDTNKGLISAQYNHLNLMTFANIGISTPYEYGSITYVYDASGAKMKKTMNNDAGLSTETEYAGNFIYENDNFQFFGHPEGYATPNGLGGFDYVYQFKDHLGNIRISYADVNDNGQMDYNEGILAENHYYPFGGRQQGKGEVYSSFGNDVAQRWRFGGKEYDESIRFEIYDFGARNYDPWLGRWMNIDPLAEQMRRHSPYNYAFDNPIYFIDPDGMMPGPPDIISRVSNTKRAGKRVQRDVSVTLTLSVVAGENDDLSSTIFSGGSGSVSLSDFEGRADSYFAPADLLANDNVTDFTVEFNVVNSLDDVGENDHVLLLVDEIPQNFGEKSNPVGRAELGGRVSAVERGTLADGSFDEVAQHELGHNTGLPHNDNIRGLMSTNVNGSTSLSSADRGRVVSGNGTGQLAHGDGDGVVKDSERSNRYSTPIKQQALDFLKNNHIQY